MTIVIGETPDEYRARQIENARMLRLRMTRPEDERLRKKQKERALITAALLFGFVFLVFAISVAKIKINW